MEMREEWGWVGHGEEGKEKDPTTIIIVIYAPARLEPIQEVLHCLCPGKS